MRNQWQAKMNFKGRVLSAISAIFGSNFEPLFKLKMPLFGHKDSAQTFFVGHFRDSTTIYGSPIFLGENSYSTLNIYCNPFEQKIMVSITLSPD